MRPPAIRTPGWEAPERLIQRAGASGAATGAAEASGGGELGAGGTGTTAPGTAPGTRSGASRAPCQLAITYESAGVRSLPRPRRVLLCGVGPSTVPACADIRVAAGGPFHGAGSMLYRLDLACDGTLSIAGWEGGSPVKLVHGLATLAFP
jgi:hypothetical protein